ncbi:hypothetical protein Tco_0351828 [Tanacetum coccineum]
MSPTAEEQPLPVAASPTTESPGYIPESDPEEDPEEDDEEDPADYPADRGDDDDDDDDAEEEHLAPADPAAVAYSADQDPYLAYRVTARMSIRPQAPAPFLSEEVAERLLALPTPPPSPLSPYSSPLPQIPSPPLPIPSQPPNSPTYVEGSLGSRAAGIRQRDALPSTVLRMRALRFVYRFVRGRVVLLLVLDTSYHSLHPSGTPPLLPIPLPAPSNSRRADIPKADTPPRKRLLLTTPRPRCEVGESSAAAAVRQP